MRSKQPVLAVILAGSLLAAACGDDDEETAATPAAEAETSAPQEETTAAETSAPEAETTGAQTTGASVAPEDIETDVGVDDTTIKVGMLADLSGVFASQVTEIVEAQEVFWDDVNAQGGIAGRQIELVIEDTGYDIATHLEKYESMRNEVAIISMSTGSPHTVAIAEMLEEDNLIAIPTTYYSGWADPDIGKNVFESYTNYCVESMNAIEWFNKNRDVQRVAVISFPGEYGGDGSAGAKMAVEQLGLELVYDGAGQVTPPSADNPSPDQTAVISQVVSADPDLVWAAVNPASLASILGSAVGQGFDGLWSGNYPTYTFKLLGTDLAPSLDQYYIASTYFVAWGTDVPGMRGLVATMTAARPDLAVSDTYVLGWTEGMTAKAILEQAAANGDMTRAGIVAAANEVEVEFNGLAPDQSWSGDPNDYIVRESYLFDVTLDSYNPAALGAAGGGSTGSKLLDGPFVSDLAQAYTYEGPCFAPTG